MKNRTSFVIGMICSVFIMINSVEAQEKMNVLNEKESIIVAVSASAARGDQAALKMALTDGLDAGITVNEFKEILVQVYAYCGFPRSLNALGTYMSLLEERGGSDLEGKLPSPLPAGKSIDFGTANQTQLCGAPVEGPLFDFAPAIDEFLKAHLFGDIFARDNLDWRTRELATIAMLTAMPGVEAQQKAHIAIGKKNGLSEEQICEIVALAQKGNRTASDRDSFPLGEENSGYAQYFSGKSWLAPLATDQSLNTPIFNVTFEPDCRNNWHKHSGGQILIAVRGVGYYQERGKAARRLVEGDVVEIPKNVEHWHGAAPGHWFSHLAVECNPQSNKNTWLEPVTEDDYKAATSEDSVPAKTQMIRLAKICVHAEQIKSYNTLLQEEIETSLRVEPGVLSLYAVAEKSDPARITIVEIYADEEAYKSHLQTPHFRKYKEGTRDMIKELELLDVDSLIPDVKMK
ncbi:MAG: carboxymuconolactone decarboxylase family protein [Planctomycetia bacterium]|nr:carboxymuconolactone decarboxylase family protein [Planctomycetia bacterium]